MERRIEDLKWFISVKRDELKQKEESLKNTRAFYRRGGYNRNEISKFTENDKKEIEELKVELKKLREELKATKEELKKAKQKN